MTVFLPPFYHRLLVGYFLTAETNDTSGQAGRRRAVRSSKAMAVISLIAAGISTWFVAYFMVRAELWSGADYEKGVVAPSQT